jgi:multicomponent Na+:H+ antiporter subunit E
VVTGVALLVGLLTLYSMVKIWNEVFWKAPTHHMRPGVIAMPLEAKTDGEITMVANLISLTPGTLSLDVSDDRKVLYIHAMFLDGDEPTAPRPCGASKRRALELFHA